MNIERISALGLLVVLTVLHTASADLQPVVSEAQIQKTEAEEAQIQGQIAQLSSSGSFFSGKLGSANSPFDCSVQINSDNTLVYISASDGESAIFSSDIFELKKLKMPDSRDSHIDVEAVKRSISNGLDGDRSTEESLVVTFDQNGNPSSVYVFNGPQDWDQISPGIALKCVISN